MTSSALPKPARIDSTIGDDGVITLFVGGEIDLQTAPALEQALLDAERARPRRIVLDLGGVGFMDSTGIHQLLASHERAAANGHTIAFRHVSGFTRRLFALSGADALWSVA